MSSTASNGWFASAVDRVSRDRGTSASGMWRDRPASTSRPCGTSERRGLVVARFRRHAGQREYDPADVSRRQGHQGCPAPGLHARRDSGDVRPVGASADDGRTACASDGHRSTSGSLGSGDVEPTWATVIAADCPSLTECSCGLAVAEPFDELSRVGPSLQEIVAAGSALDAGVGVTASTDLSSRSRDTRPSRLRARRASEGFRPTSATNLVTTRPIRVSDEGHLGERIGRDWRCDLRAIGSIRVSVRVRGRLSGSSTRGRLPPRRVPRCIAATATRPSPRSSPSRRSSKPSGSVTPSTDEQIRYLVDRDPPGTSSRTTIDDAAPRSAWRPRLVVKEIAADDDGRAWRQVDRAGGDHRRVLASLARSERAASGAASRP